MSDITPVETDLILTAAENPARKFATETLLQPSEAFGRYANSLVPLEATDSDRIGVIQEAARRYNGEADNQRQIFLLFHFTDNEGVTGIAQTNILGKDNGDRVYLTPITPEMAKPLSSAEDAKGYEKYFRDKAMPANLREHIDRFVLGLKFKWQYDVLKSVKGKLGTPIIPVGAHKLENVVIVASERNNPSLKEDEHGEIFTEKPIKIGVGPEFSTFGPYRTATQSADSKPV
jgi:hypothetical protein